MDSEILIYETSDIDCSFEPLDNQLPTGSEGAKSRPKQKSYRKKVESAWTHEYILKLIEEVEARRSLWDAGCAEYKLPKYNLWQEVADIIQVSVNDCKGKWTNLRTSFNCNLEKFRKKKSGQGTDEQFQIVWRYFKPMMFLETTKVRQATQSISSMQLNSATTDESTVDELGFSDELASISPCTFGKKRSRQSTATTSSTPSSNVNLKEMALEALQSLRSADSQPKDACTVFGEYVAAELRNLSPEQASFARAKLRRSLIDILDEAALIVPQQQNQE
ncbi:uncharacterized protein LOC135950426 [Calliphora vicina]|uniref:uncharacterized protein LOC135950426 n=1 Tax=Calliphora vicina TaxID=7373 RepID=UPI00325B1100